MYRIEINSTEKLFVITLAGIIDTNESNAYLIEYESYVQNNDYSDYNLIVDTADLKIGSHELEDNMKKAMELNFSTPFKARYNIVPKSAVTNLQANRVGKDFNLKEQFITVQSLEEILSQVK